jgi:D-alanyl-D-alanine carboxypeptidase
VKNPSSFGRRRLIFSSLGSAVLGACGGGGGQSTSPASVAVPAQDATPSPPTAVSNLPDPRMNAIAQSLVGGGLAGVALVYLNSPTALGQVAVAGVRQLNGTEPIAANDVFNIGSLTKAMTACVISSVVARGLLRWDTRIVEALPELSGVINTAYLNVTIEQLLAHQGGMPAIDGLDGDAQVFIATRPGNPAGAEPSLAEKRRDFARWLVQQNPPSGITVGRDFFYSNGGYTLAATMAQAAAKESFESLFESLIVQKLGIQGQWRMTSETIAAYQPVGHVGPASGSLARYTPGVQDKVAEPWLRAIAPAGYWACDPTAYALWLRWHVLALQGQSTPLPPVYVQRIKALGPDQYDLGWRCFASAGRQYLEHMGSVEGFMSCVMLETQGRSAGFGVSNVGYFDTATGDSWVWAQLRKGLLELDAGFVGSNKSVQIRLWGNIGG